MAIHTGLALFAGGGGLELGLSLALGTDYRTIAYVEREATSAAVLAANMERGWLDKAPVWDDVTTFTGDAVSPLVDNIDIISAGFPCQPWSVAGSRKGTEDERWLWPLIFRLVREIRPRSIFLENVPGLLHGGIEHVLGGLASLGYDAEWTTVRASDVGASHRRERVFILGYSRHQPLNIQQRRLRPEHTGTGSELGDPESVEPWSGQAPQREASSITRSGRDMGFPPGPSDTDAWAAILTERPDLAPAVEPDVRGVADGVARGLARADQLRILGNGCVPQQVALAYTLLRERLAAPHR